MPKTHRSGASTGGSTPFRLADGSPQKSKRDTRRRERLKISLPLHVRPFDPRFEGIDDVGQVVDFTRDGIYFRTCMPHYFLGMRLIVTFPYGDKVSAHRKFLVTVVRLGHRGNGSSGVAVRFLL
jgi:hypothetical protein